MLNLKHLYYYHIFAQELSTTKAAKRLQISPPALSNQLKDLEGFLGFKLTDRVHGKVEITEFGTMIAHYADRMFSAYDDLKTKIALDHDMECDSYRVGISHYLGTRFSFDLLNLIAQSHLSMAKKVTVNFLPSEKVLERFKDDHFDVIVGAFPTALSGEDSWVSQTLAFPVRLFTPMALMNDLELERKRLLFADPNLMIEHANNRKISVVLPSHPSQLRNETERFLTGLNVAPAKTIECNSSGGIVQLIERGFAMGFAPTPCLLDFKSGQCLKVLGPPGGYWTHEISMIALKGTDRPLTKVSPWNEILTPAPGEVH